MMEEIRQYIVTVTAGAVLCGILKGLLPGKDASASVLRLVSGIFLAFTVIYPFTQVNLADLPVISVEFLAEAEAASAEGEIIAAEAMVDIIKRQTEAYILDKARLLNAELTVEVTLSSDTVPTPVGVRLTGTISPYAKSRLQSILENDLGISKENQIWIG